MNNRGFTLVEVLIYLGLYALLIGGAVVAAYNMVESSGRNETAAMVEEEGQYLTAKIDWALGSQEMQNPTFDVASGSMRLSWGSNTPQGISNSNVSVSDFVLATSTDLNAASFTLTALTPNGSAYVQKFSTTQ
jgi:Tfp pilus assembly protein PilE